MCLSCVIFVCECCSLRVPSISPLDVLTAHLIRIRWGLSICWLEGLYGLSPETIWRSLSFSLARRYLKLGLQSQHSFDLHENIMGCGGSVTWRWGLQGNTPPEPVTIGELYLPPNPPITQSPWWLIYFKQKGVHSVCMCVGLGVRTWSTDAFLVLNRRDVRCDVKKNKTLGTVDRTI